MPQIIFIRHAEKSSDKSDQIFETRKTLGVVFKICILCKERRNMSTFIMKTIFSSTALHVVSSTKEVCPVDTIQWKVSTHVGTVTYCFVKV